MDAGTIDTVIAALESVQGFDCRGGIVRLSGNKELYYRLITLFFSSRRPDAIRSALSDNNTECVISEAHALKGAALNMGFNSIADCSGEIEASAKAGQTVQAKQSLERLENVYLCALNSARLPQI